MVEVVEVVVAVVVVVMADLPRRPQIVGFHQGFELDLHKHLFLVRSS